MARPLKKGLHYFNIDCVQADSLNYIEAKHGITGYGIVVKLWRKIYMVEGYYCEWNDKNVYLFAREIGVDTGLVASVVESCFAEEILDRGLYDQYQVLTSAGIQRRYIKIVTEAKRKSWEIDPKFMLLELTPEKTGFPPEETPKIREESTQKKRKENKEKIPEDTGAPADAGPVTKPGIVKKSDRKKFVPPDYNEVLTYFLQLRGNPKGPGYWPADKINLEAGTFVDHYTANGWLQNKGKPILDWQAAVRNWIRNVIKGQFDPARSHVVPSPQSASTPAQPIVTMLTKDQLEINYLYERFLENQCTVVSIYPANYNLLKSAGMISFNDDELRKIDAKVRKKMGDSVDVAIETSLKKKYGVLYFFVQQKNAGRLVIFEK